MRDIVSFSGNPYRREPKPVPARPRIIDSEHGDGRLTDYLQGHVGRVLIVFRHGVGDLIMFLSPLETLQRLYPRIHFDLALAEGLDQEAICPQAILLDGNWRQHIAELDYDIVFVCHFPMEDFRRPSTTKAELCCEKELGIKPINGHRRLSAKKLVGVHFQATSVPGLANANRETAVRIWSDIIDAGYVPVETHFEHLFHNPANTRFDFADNHVRTWTPRLTTLMALLGACEAFVGVVSGNFHLALSILGPQRVLLLENELKASQLTKEKIATSNLKNYSGEVRTWLLSNSWNRP
jgi:hypothetical protein